MTDSIYSKPNRAADKDEYRRIYIQKPALKNNQDRAQPAKPAGINPDVVVYVDSQEHPPAPSSLRTGDTFKLTEAPSPLTASGKQAPSRAAVQSARSSRARREDTSYIPRIRTQKRRRTAKKASAFKAAAVCTFLLGICCLLAFTGVAESILFPYTQTLHTSQLGHDSYNTAFEFITYEFPVEISVGDEISYAMLSSGSTVQEALEDAGIVLGDLDSTNLPLDHVMSDSDQIEIEVVDIQTRTQERFIPYATKTVDSQTVPKGATKVITKGKQGIITDTYECRYINGEPAGETLLSSVSTSPPVDEVVHRGVGGVFTAPDGTKYSYSYYVDVSATAYGDVSEGTNPKWHGITAIGEKVRPGIIGVDPDVIPFRSNVYVIGNYGDFGVCYAADCGLAKGNILDIYMETYAEMVKFGRRNMRAYVLE